MMWRGMLIVTGIVVIVITGAFWITRETTCLTVNGRELCGDQAQAYCEATEPLRAMLDGLGNYRRDNQAELEAVDPEFARQVTEQGADTDARLAEADRACAPFD
jgi:hypothetical protein